MELKSGEGTVVVADRDRCCNVMTVVIETQAGAPVVVQSVVHW